MDTKDLLSITGSLTTILQFLAGIPICRDIWRKGSTDGISGLPFLAGVLGCSLWFRYSLILQDQTMCLVNLIGLILQVCYVLIYLLYPSTQKATFHRQLGTILAILFGVIYYCSIEPKVDIAKFRLGVICCLTTLFFCASPLASLRDVIRMKNTAPLPFPLILLTALVTGQWYLYGVCIGDSVVQLPNLIGCMIATFQLSLFLVYPRTPAVKPHGDCIDPVVLECRKKIKPSDSAYQRTLLKKFQA
ncbi:hypothetical protein QYM36_007960, partial [Artemia franciscana]